MKKQYVYGYGKSQADSKDKIIVAVLVGVCIAATMITFLTVGLIKKYKPEYSSGNIDKEAEKIVVNSNASEEDIKVVTGTTEDVATTETPKNIPDNILSDSVIEDVTELFYEPPCFGSIIHEFSPDMPLYSKTLDDWRVHNGIDIHVPLGTQVLAVADGIVKNTTNDFRYGHTIVIEHNDGNRSIYSNLVNTDMVRIGRHVKKGDVIARVGDTALFETVADTHLHFEMIKGEQYLNPLDYFSLQ